MTLYAIHQQEREHGPPGWIVTLWQDDRAERATTRAGLLFLSRHEEGARQYARERYPRAQEITHAQLDDLQARERIRQHRSSRR